MRPNVPQKYLSEAEPVFRQERIHLENRESYIIQRTPSFFHAGADPRCLPRPARLRANPAGCSRQSGCLARSSSRPRRLNRALSARPRSVHSRYRQRTGRHEGAHRSARSGTQEPHSAIISSTGDPRQHGSIFARHSIGEPSTGEPNANATPISTRVS